MADVETPAAESSPAAQPVTEPQSGSVETSIPTEPKAYAKWRETGELPGEEKPSGDDSATSKKKSADEPSGKGAPAPEAGKQRQERTNADTRKEELNREIRELLAQRDTLRKEVIEPGKKDVKAEPSPAPEEGLKRPVKPKQEDFDSWDKYEAAQDKYLEDLADFKATERLEKHTQQQQQEAETKAMQKRLDEAKERYGAEAEPKIIATAKAVFDDKAVAPALKIAMGRSEVLVDSLYVMGSDTGEFEAFLDLAKKDPLEALRKWFTVEALVKEELKKGTPKTDNNGATPRGADGKFLPPDKPPAKPIKGAPAPPVELNGSASPPGDERERAVSSGNFRAFKADADRRDIQRFRGQ